MGDEADARDTFAKRAGGLAVELGLYPAIEIDLGAEGALPRQGGLDEIGRTH